MRNFQCLAVGLNVGPLVHQLVLHPELWNRDRVRTAHKGSPHKAVDDVLLRFQALRAGLDASREDSLRQRVVDECECIWFPAWDVLTEAHGLIFDLARAVRAERIGRVLISRLPPGGVIAPHEDGGSVATYYTRYQLPLQSEPGCVFECDGEAVQMRAGEAWWFDNKRTHAVVNNSAADRISLIVDLRTR